MALKNLKSQFDLVNGGGPVGNMENQQGPSFNLGPNSILQQESLPQIPNQSPFQDLNGEIGPQSQLPTEEASQNHINSLQEVPGGDSNSPFQDLNGNAGPQSQLPQDAASQVHIDSLQQVPGFSSNSPFQDLNGEVGPQSQLPIDDASQAHIDSLQQVPGFSSNSPYQDLNGVDGGNGYFHGIANPAQGQGKQIQKQDLHVHLLQNGYSYNHGNSTETIGEGQFDLNGVGDFGVSTFDNGPTSTLHEDLLNNTYQSNINAGASYGQGQPGASWPSVNAGAFDLNGALPNNGEYLNNLPS
tara:strand:- start:261 stop:1157 length:897 start_codon:yes stop_codon:yes gene_type:complete